MNEGARGKTSGAGALLVGAVVFLTALAYRAYLSRWLTFPAPVDACYYYDVAVSLARGRGFEIGYVWNYLNNVPQGLPVPSNEYWQPLVSIILAGTFKVIGTSWQAAKFCGALFGSFMAVLCLWYGLRAGLGLGAATCAALLLAYQPSVAFASTSDTSVYSGVIVAAALVCAIKGGERGGYCWAYAGGLAGLAYLVRSDGLLALVAVVAAWFYYRKRGERRGWELAACLACFALVIAPWLVRNAIVFGKPMPVGIAKVALLSRYPDVFATRPEAFTLKAFIQSGLVYQGVSRLLALQKNVEDLFRLISFVVLPFAVYELIRSRREDTHWPVLFYFLLAFLFTGLVIPFAGRKGTFEHLLPATEVFFWPLGMLGVTHLWRTIPVVRRASPLLGVGLATALVAAHYTHWTVRSVPELVKMCRNREQLQVLADRWLDRQPGSDRIVLTDDPWSLHYRTGRLCAMIPADDYPRIVRVARHFGCRYVLWRPKERLLDWPLGARTDERVVFRICISEQVNVFELFYPESQGGEVSAQEVARAHLRAGVESGQTGYMEAAPWEFYKALLSSGSDAGIRWNERLQRWDFYEAPLRDASNFEALLYLGAAWRRLGRFPESRQALERALKLRPQDGTALGELALARQGSAAASPIPLPAIGAEN